MNQSSEDLIAYCGLYCGECFGHEGKIANLARDLRKELRGARFDKISEAIPFKAFKNYGQCYEVLGALVKLRCKKACRGGGANPACTIRKCCRKKELQGCWECGEFESCKKLDTLETGHGVAHIKNLRKLKKKGVEAFLDGKKLWYVKS